MRSERIGYSTLFNCDCKDLMATLPDKSISLAIVDPPYGGSNHEMHNCKSVLNDGSVYRTGGAWASKYGSHINNWDIAPDEKYFNELFRVSKYQIIWGGNYFPLPPSRNFIIWRKKTISENFSMAMAEYAWTNIQGNAKVFEYQPQDPDRFHPTQKPVALYKWLLSKYAKQGDKILDTHFGSGSIAVACNEMGFELVASEIDQDYYNAAVLRVKEADKQGLLFTAV